MKYAYRPSTTSAHRTHVRAYFAFLHIMDLPPTTTLHNIMVFIEYLHQNHISHKVISAYLSSVRSMASLYNLPLQPFSHPAITRLLRSISLTSHFPLPPEESLTSQHYITFPFHVTLGMIPTYIEPSSWSPFMVSLGCQI